MTKRYLNQNDKYVNDLINSIEPDFIFSTKPINRFKTENIEGKNFEKNKLDQIADLKKKINSIENCNLKENSKRLVMGEGNNDSSIMLIGEAPGFEEESSGLPFQGKVGELLNKMLIAIKIEREKIYLTYSVNFRTPEDRKPTSVEIKRYSKFLKEHISMINPKIIILLGSTAMEAITGSISKISEERGKWKEIIIKHKTFPLMVTFSPSYLIRFPENKKYSWEDLKKIKQKIQKFNIKI